ncbi:MAG TPA: anthranilate phosphoribosyltransferase [Clostridia bacterium]|nr:anthranilate phosphoribosyltransferase [Clostridia bacterium]
MVRTALQKLSTKENLTEREAIEAMNCVMEGNATQSQIGGFLTALRFKGETVEEIVGFARVMREKSAKVPHKLQYCIDTCGTGGDGARTFNISTAASFIAAAAGAKIAKHGNRAMSSKSGSADVLEALGVNIGLSPELVGKSIEEVGVGFMFAQLFHQSMKHAAGVRKELGIRTVFNILGPLTNPAGAKGQLLGVFDGNITGTMAEALKMLGAERALVVHGCDGLDEITTTGATKVAELKDGVIKEYYIDTTELGIPRAEPMELAGGDAAYNAGVISSILAGEKGARRNIVLVNAAAAIYVAKLAGDIKEGLRIAESMIDSGLAAAKLEELRRFTEAAAGTREVSA